MRTSKGFNLQINNSGYSYLVSFFAGLSLVFAYAPFSLWPIALLALLVWFTQLDQRSPKQAFYQGLAFGFGWFGAGISWVHVSIEQFGGMPLFVSVLLMILLCGYLALYPALAAWLSAKLSINKTVNLYFLPFVWLLSEYLRAHMLTGFPWLALGYSQIDGPFAALAPFIGEVGIGFVLLYFAVAAFKRIKRKQIRLTRIILLSSIVAITLTHNVSNIEETGENINVALVQGNIKQELRWDEAQEQNIINSYIDDSKGLYQSHDLVIWPEAAIPRIEPLAQEYLQQLDEQAFEQNSALITGIINYDPDSRSFFNRLVMLGKKQDGDKLGDYYYRNSNHYDKHHLLPIGEFVPFASLLRPLAPFFNLPMSSFSRGDYVQKNLLANNLNIAPLICFEIVFPKQLAANMNQQTDLLLTVSNDAWFGDSHGPHQHLEIARMRALEFGRPMLRSTNNGITAVINHNGEIIADIPQFTKTTLSTQVPLVSGATFYSQYALHLDKLLFLIFLISLIWHKFSFKKSNKYS
ncbi:apolipoprotein N-acyltransferase [Thalassomonas sp. M1454]|uniref:apolipoprotein N-acyltransferase n=1 Tax=Thalassomonas sp. M1454 TaxID=2594477 RepID=UPI00117DDEA4|nr:apolipoprotein N-acyltransferase [Thalassomonas sp. M1454]TRX55690.1 apolipoprotein N-acyltransferase [Thalassomonas sp. M1454]